MSSPSAAPWRAGLLALKANRVPAVIIPLFAVALVVVYYQVPALRSALAGLSALRAKIGPLYGILGTAFFGGLLPLAVLKLTPSTRRRYTPRQAAAVLLFWAWKGLEVYLWYALLALVFGDGGDLKTSLIKTLCDQLIFCPLWAVPLCATVFAAIERGSLSPVLADMRRPRWYSRVALPVLLTNLAIWIPSCTALFLLPPDLQQFLFNLVMCFFTLVMAHLSLGEKAEKLEN
jgi:hypothetical protein